MSDFGIGTFLGQFIGTAVAEGQPEPSDPIAPAPGDERSGPLAEPLPPSTDPGEDPLNYPPTGRQVENHPIPLIGTVPFGGIILAAGCLVSPDGNLAVQTIGDNGGQTRPGVLGIYLASAGDIYLFPDAVPGTAWVGNRPTLSGAVIPVSLFLPVRRLNIGTTAVTSATGVTWLLIGSDLGAST